MKKCITILFADDDEDDRMLFAAAIDKLQSNIKLLLANDGRSALEMLAVYNNNPPDLIFLDVNMPGMDGWQCLYTIKQDLQLKQLKVIMYSTSNHKEDRERALASGAFCFCTKPDNFNKLVQLLRIIIENFSGDLKTALLEAKICIFK